MSYAYGTKLTPVSVGVKRALSPNTTGFPVVGNGLGGLPVRVSTKIPGGVIFDSPGGHEWVVPIGVTSITILGVGGGGSGSCQPYAGKGGAGGALAYVNDLAVIPGSKLQVFVGAGGGPVSAPLGVPANGNSGGNTYVIYNSIVVLQANGGQGGQTGSSVATGGSVAVGVGFRGGDSHSDSCAGAGGAGGYYGAGGAGGGSGGASGGAGVTGHGGSGGGGGGGGRYDPGGATNWHYPGGDGGGVGLFGAGADGTAGAGRPYNTPGTGGPGGAGSGGRGKYYGGGGGGNYAVTTSSPQPIEQYASSPGGGGAVRIIYPGASRLFPATNVGDI